MQMLRRTFDNLGNPIRKNLALKSSGLCDARSRFRGAERTGLGVRISAGRRLEGPNPPRV